MKIDNKIQNYDDYSNKRLLNTAYTSYNFDKIPPIIGIITANKYGNTLMVFEYEKKDYHNYGPIKSYLSDDDKNLLEIDLISMYFSSIKAFAGQTNIQNLSNLEIHGSNIKIQIYFLFDNFMIILFLNSKVDLNLKEKTQIVHFFEDQLTNYEFEFKHFNATDSRKIIGILERKGKCWLKRLNRKYIEIFKNRFLKKHEIIEMIVDKITPIIRKELTECFTGIPENIIKDVSKEIRNKIQDEISEFNSDIFN